MTKQSTDEYLDVAQSILSSWAPSKDLPGLCTQPDRRPLQPPLHTLHYAAIIGGVVGGALAVGLGLFYFAYGMYGVYYTIAAFGIAVAGIVRAALAGSSEYHKERKQYNQSRF